MAPFLATGNIVWRRQRHSSRMAANRPDILKVQKCFEVLGRKLRSVLTPFGTDKTAAVVFIIP